jgi:hypothetical protein
MVGNGQYLHQPIDFSVNKVKVKDLENDAANVWCDNDAQSSWRSTNPFQGMSKFGVVTRAQPHLNFFVVSDLFFVFFCGRGVEPIPHFKSA